MGHKVSFRVSLAAGAALAGACCGVTLTGTPPASAAAGTDRLIASASEQLNPTQYLVSPNGWYELLMQQDGNLVEYASGSRPVWASGTSRRGSIARMQPDGNLVIIAPGNVPVWATGTNGTPGADVELQNDGNLVVYGQGHAARWASGAPAVPAHPYPANFNPAAAGIWADDNIRNVAPDQAKDPCAQFVSRSLHAVGLPYDHGQGWFPVTDATAVEKYINDGVNPQWYGVQGLRQYLLAKGWVSQQLIYPGVAGFTAAPGDIIYYEWNGQATLQHVHVAIVTGVYGSTVNVADQNTTSDIGANRVWNVSGASGTVGRPLISLYPGMKAYILHWR